MADKYSTIQQHQPLRVPAGWQRQERALIVQLDEILDDIYRRFGRLGLTDLSKSLQFTIGNKYDKISGILINEDGVNISGSKSVSIEADNTRWEYGKDGIEFWVQPSGSTGYQQYGAIASEDYFARRPADHPNGIGFGEDWIKLYSSHIGAFYNEPEHIRIGKGRTSSTETWFCIAPSDTSFTFALGESSRPWTYVYYTNAVQPSSREKKHSIFDMKPVGEKLDRLNPVTFIYNDDESQRVRNGLIYEDTVDILPEICVSAGEEKGISYIELVPMLLKEIQDLRKRVAVLEAKANA